MNRTVRHLAALVAALALLCGWTYDAQAACVGGAPDGILAPPTEACDDGNANNNDGCKNDCTIAEFYECTLAVDFQNLKDENMPAPSQSASQPAYWTLDTYSGKQWRNTGLPTFAYFNANAFAQVYTFSVYVDQDSYSGNGAVGNNCGNRPVTECPNRGDDDFIGFALGFQPGHSDSEDANFLFVDWKAVTQSGASAGMKLSHAQGLVQNTGTTSNDYWQKTGSVKTLKEASGTYRNTGWKNRVAYEFEITYTLDSLRVRVKDTSLANPSFVEVFNVQADDSSFEDRFSSGFPAGQIAFYGLSQPNVIYSLIHPLTSICTPICGDGHMTGGETCETGDANCHDETCRFKVAITEPTLGTSTSSPRPTIHGTADAGATVRVVLQQAGQPDVVLTGIIADANGAWSTTPTADLAPGTYSIRATATDTAVHKGQSTATSDVTILDHDVDIVTPLANAIVGSTIPVTGTGTAGASIALTLNGVSVGTTTVQSNGSWSANITVPTGTSQGPATIKAVSTLAGNPSTPEDQVTVKLDLSTTVSISTPADGSKHNTPVSTISGKGEPGAVVTLTIDGVGYGTPIPIDTNGNWSVTLPAGDVLTDGSHTVIALAEDGVGNTATATSNFSVDTTTFVTIATPANGSFSNQAVSTITGSGEVGGTVVLTVNGTTYAATPVIGANGLWSVTLNAPLGDGTYTATAVITDDHGNTDTATSDFTIGIDKCLNHSCTAGEYCFAGDGVCYPNVVVVITTPADGSTTDDRTPTISGTSVPNATITVTIDGTTIPGVTVDSNGNWNVTPTVPLADGGHAVTAVATLHGHTGTDTNNFTVDTEICGETGPGGRDTCDEDTTVCRNTGDNTFTCDCQGNLIKHNPNDTVCVDRPYVIIESPEDASITRTATPTLSGDANPGYTVEIFIDGTKVGDTVADSTGLWTFTVPAGSALNGSGDYDFKATNTVGSEVAEDEITLTYIPGNQVIIDTPTEGQWVSNTPTVTGTSRPNAEITIVVNGDEKGSTTSDEHGNWSWTPGPGEELADGPSNIEAIDEDIQEQDDVNVLVNVDLCEDAANNDCGANTVCDYTGGGNYSCPCAPGYIRENANDTDCVYKPYVTIDTPADGSTIRTATPTLTGTANPGVPFDLRIFDLNGNVLDSSTVTALPDGSWSFVVPAGVLTSADSYIFNAEISIGADTAEDEITLVYDDAADIVVITSPNDGDKIPEGSLLTVTGTSNPGATITITIRGEEQPTTTTADENGQWTWTSDQPLTMGDAEIIATDKDADEDDRVTVYVEGPVCEDSSLNVCNADSICVPDSNATAGYTCECNEGFMSEPGNELNCVAKPAIEITSPADQSTVRTGTPTLKGTATPNNEVVVELVDDILGTVELGRVISDADGNWSFTVDAANELTEDGPYDFVASTTKYGETATDELTLIVDLRADIVIIETPEEGDFVPSQPTVTGTSNPGATITIIIRGKEEGTTTADENGQWTWTGTEKLPHGPAEIIARDKDVDEEDSVNVIIDRDLIPVTITGPADKSETDDRTPTVIGKGEPGTDVTIEVDGKEVAKVPVDENGNWTWTPEEDLSIGEHTITAKGVGGSQDQIQLTITDGEAEPSDDELEISGGRLFGCSSTGGNAPWAAIASLALGAALLRRRRAAAL